MNYTKETASFISHNAQDTIFYYTYTPKTEIKAILQISHGMCEYIGRYEQFADFLAGEGILLCGNDHLGHGKSVASKEDFGYFKGSQGWRHLYEDVFQLTQIMQKSYPELPYFLLGHSMGSFVARAYLTKYSHHLDGAIITGTSGPNPLGKLGILMTKILAKFKGDRFRSPFMTKLSFKNYNKFCENPQTDMDWLTRDSQIFKAYEADELCNFDFTLNGYRNLYQMLEAVSAPNWASKIKNRLPILLASGEADPVGNYTKGVTQVYTRLQNAGFDDLTLKFYPKFRHEILNEIDKQIVYADILNWLNSHINPI